MDLIDRDALIEHIMDADSILNEYLLSGDYAPIGEALGEAIDAIRNAKPVVHGEWMHHGMDIPEHPNRCGVCSWGNHHIDRYVVDFNFCPNCGAAMRGEQHD